MPSVRVNDIELYYEVHGEGSPLLLIPGLGVDVNFFRGIIDDLARSCRVVVFDPRGAGRSDKPDIPYSIDGMAKDRPRSSATSTSNGPPCSVARWAAARR